MNTATRSVRIELAPKSISLLILIIAGLWALKQLLAIIVLITCAFILVGTLHPLVQWVEKRRIKRLWAITIVFVACLTLLGLIALVTFPSLWNQLTQMAVHFPSLQSKFSDVLAAHRITAPLSETVRNFGMGKAAAGVNVVSAVSVSLGIVEIVGYTATAFVLAIYFISDYESMRGALYAVVPRNYHVRLARILLNLEPIVGGYMRGQVVTSLAAGTFTFCLLTICHVPNALALAAFAGITDVMPFIGGLLATTPAVLSALSRSIGIASIVLVAMLGYQEFESRVLVPKVYGRALRLSPAVVVIALLIGGKLGGIIGALLALPLAAALRMLFEELRFELPGDDTDDRQLKKRDERAERDYAKRSAGTSPEEASVVATQIADQVRKSDEANSKDPSTVPITDGGK